MPCQALVKMLAKKPGWKETNFQVSVDDGRSILEHNSHLINIIIYLSCVTVLQHCSSKTIDQ